MTLTKTRTKTDTATIVAEMLRENTGRGMCDSGGIPQYDAEGHYTGSTCGYGRAYERNAERAFEKEADVSLWIDKYGIDYRIRLYAYLVAYLEHASTWQRLFDRFAKRPEFEYTHWLEIMEQFPDYLEGLGWKTHGLYGDGKPMVINTYNEETHLDQDMQFMLLSIEDRDVLFLVQSHNGADAREGYPRPRVFSTITSDEASFLCGYNDGIICCEGISDCPVGQLTLDGERWVPPIHTWNTDDAYHWYNDRNHRETQLQEFEIQELPDDAVASELVKENPGILYCDKNGVGYCPVCGAKLVAGQLF